MQVSHSTKRMSPKWMAPLEPKVALIPGVPRQYGVCQGGLINGPSRANGLKVDPAGRGPGRCGELV